MEIHECVLVHTCVCNMNDLLSRGRRQEGAGLRKANHTQWFVSKPRSVQFFRSSLVGGHMRVCVSMAIQSGMSVTTQTVGENTSEGALSDNEGNFLL